MLLAIRTAACRARLLRAPLVVRSLADSADGYLASKSRLPMHHFLASLPVVPVPKLEDTIARYLDAAAPLVPAQQFAQTKLLAEAFLKNRGPVLQAACLDIARRTDNYIDDAWSRMYLEAREPIMINSNPQLTLANDPTKRDQVQRATALVLSSVRFYRTMRDGRLAPELFYLSKMPPALFEPLMRLMPSSIVAKAAMACGVIPLDMSRNRHLFHTNRAPGLRADCLVHHADGEADPVLGGASSSEGAAKAGPPRHIVVQRGHAFFAVDVLDQAGAALPAQTIAAALAAIVAQPLDKTSPPLGVLTAGNRTRWAETRARLAAEPSGANALSLRTIESGLFALCLEDGHAEDGMHDLAELLDTTNLTYAQALDKLRAVGEDPFELIHMMLHGSARNRWFDKSFQWIVDARGVAAVNFEHSWGDGIAVLRLCNEVFADSKNIPASAVTAPALSDVASQHVRPLPFVFDETSRSAIVAAAAEADALIASLDYAAIMVRSLGRKFFKAQNLPADATTQLLMQLAYYRTLGHSGSSYESATMAYYKKGRTETIRPASRESDAFCRAMCSPHASNELRTTLMRAAVAKHNKLARDAQLGRGMDRHMFVLHDCDLAAVGRDASKVDALFRDPTFATVRNIVLSTSTLPHTPAIASGGFGPVSPQCYAVGYSVHPDYLGFVTCTFKQRTADFAHELDVAAEQMRSLIATPAVPLDVAAYAHFAGSETKPH